MATAVEAVYEFREFWETMQNCQNRQKIIAFLADNPSVDTIFFRDC